ncbi:MAG: hypothetical protein E6G08_08595 [Actinobacteria bacterium]|nr:MAG: hypothetical protein E6G08_08595 [Actinomycetota bacterium]
MFTRARSSATPRPRDLDPRRRRRPEHPGRRAGSPGKGGGRPRGAPRRTASRTCTSAGCLRARRPPCAAWRNVPSEPGPRPRAW